MYTLSFLGCWKREYQDADPTICKSSKSAYVILLLFIVSILVVDQMKGNSWLITYVVNFCSTSKKVFIWQIAEELINSWYDSFLLPIGWLGGVQSCYELKGYLLLLHIGEKKVFLLVFIGAKLLGGIEYCVAEGFLSTTSMLSFLKMFFEIMMPSPSILCDYEFEEDRWSFIEEFRGNCHLFFSTYLKTLFFIYLPVSALKILTFIPSPFVCWWPNCWDRCSVIWGLLVLRTLFAFLKETIFHSSVLEFYCMCCVWLDVEFKFANCSLISILDSCLIEQDICVYPIIPHHWHNTSTPL